MPVRYHSTAASLLVDADQVRPHPDNPRNGDTDAIVASIRQVGCYRPVYAWAQTGEILAGNHTYHALLELGEPQIPVAWIEATSREEAVQILLNDNHAADLGRYDEAQLLALLEELDAHGDLPATYTPDDVANIRALLDDAAWGDRDGTGGHGADDPDEDAFRPKIELQVPARVFDAWRMMLEEQTGENDAVKLAAHLQAGGWLTE